MTLRTSPRTCSTNTDSFWTRSLILLMSCSIAGRPSGRRVIRARNFRPRAAESQFARALRKSSNDDDLDPGPVRAVDPGAGVEEGQEKRGRGPRSLPIPGTNG